MKNYFYFSRERTRTLRFLTVQDIANLPEGEAFEIDFLLSLMSQVTVWADYYAEYCDWEDDDEYQENQKRIAQMYKLYNAIRDEYRRQNDLKPITPFRATS